MNPQKVLVVGLDGATFDLIDPLIAAGKLPALARLIESGARGPLRSTLPHHSAPAWTSFATGLGPGRHGIYSFFQRDYSGYRFSPVNSRYIRGEALWKQLSRAGKTVGIMNVPGTYPPAPVNGFLISGMLSPTLEQAFYPPQLHSRVVERVPHYSVEAIPLLDKDAYLDQVTGSIEARKQAALFLLEEYPSDLFVVVFTELDRLQHFFWNDMDVDHPAHATGTSPEHRGAIEAGYIALDRAVTELVEAAGPDTLVFLVSDHGFEGVYKLFYVNAWLAKHGYLALTRRRTGSAIRATKRGLQKLGLWQLARRGRAALSRAGLARVDHLRSDSLSYAADIDWARTSVAFGPNLGLNVNLKGREPKGVVCPGSEYDELCLRLRDELESWVDPDTGERVVSKVVSREEVYQGEALELAPDLRLIMAKSTGYPGRYAYSPDLGTSQILGFPDRVYGNHAEYGILAVSGPGIRGGWQIEGAGIVDIAPTILASLGMPIPDSMDGHPLMDLFEMGPYSGDGPDRALVAEPSRPEEQKLSPAEELEVLDRLRGLGYLS